VVALRHVWRCGLRSESTRRIARTGDLDWPTLPLNLQRDSEGQLQHVSLARVGDAPAVCLVGGTRPEALKLGPVAAAMGERGRLRPVIIASGQHPSMFHRALSVFGLRPDAAVTLARGAGGQAELASLLLPELDAMFDQYRPSAVVVQGDTATTLAAALAGFWRQLPVIHLEAGLRSRNLAAPFPEEGNRRLVGQIASLHLAPTPRAERNLAEEGITGSEVITIGNTIVDAALAVSGSYAGYADGRIARIVDRAAAAHTRLVLVTMHRRESWGPPMRRVLTAVEDLIREVPDVDVVLPVHPNPALRDEVRRALGRLDRVIVTEPLPYVDLLRLMRDAALVLSDSGGIQEEAVSFGVPILVLRDVTERMEAVECGFARLVGTNREAIVTYAVRLLNGDLRHALPPAECNPFGDGRARYRAEQAIAWHLGLQFEPPVPFVPAEPETVTGKAVTGVPS
jgi:UDP-N-acetylglucosamine 2-epimerase (non-hydrolysing)